MCMEVVIWFVKQSAECCCYCLWKVNRRGGVSWFLTKTMLFVTMVRSAVFLLGDASKMCENGEVSWLTLVSLARHWRCISIDETFSLTFQVVLRTLEKVLMIQCLGTFCSLSVNGWCWWIQNSSSCAFWASWNLHWTPCFESDQKPQYCRGAALMQNDWCS